MPWPVSAMVIRMPVRPEMVIGDVVGADDESASARTHGVDGVGDEVVENLSDVVFEAQDGAGGLVASFDANTGVDEAALVEIEDGVTSSSAVTWVARTAWRWKRRVWVAIWQTRESSLWAVLM